MPWSHPKVQNRLGGVGSAPACIPQLRSDPPKKNPGLGPEGWGYRFKSWARTSLVVQWLRLHASTAGGVGWILGWGTKIPHATCCRKQNKTPQVVSKQTQAIDKQQWKNGLPLETHVGPSKRMDQQYNTQVQWSVFHSVLEPLLFSWLWSLPYFMLHS